MSTEGRDNLSLYQIEADLQELMAAYSEAEEDATREAIEAGIREYVEREVMKVDGIRSYLRHCEVMADAAKAEAAAQLERSKQWTKRAEKLESACLAVMTQMGKKRLEGNTGALVAKKNGGVAPIEITDEMLVPDEFCVAQVEMPWVIWDCADKVTVGIMPEHVKVKRVVSNTAIRKSIDLTCWACNGICSEENPCSLCGNSGLAGVPGARLLERGSSLQVK